MVNYAWRFECDMFIQPFTTRQHVYFKLYRNYVTASSSIIISFITGCAIAPHCCNL